MLARIKEELERKQIILLGRRKKATEIVGLTRTQMEAMSPLHDRSEQQIEEIEEALQRMEDGSYGVCEECGQPIRLERLYALPTASLCIDCQEKLERV